MMFTTKRGTRDVYGETLAELGHQDSSIVVLTADLAGSTKTSVFAAEHPDRFYNMGVAEANMIGTAAGLAMSGFRPFVSTFAMFATGKVWEQIRQVVAYPKTPVRIVATHAGLTVGEDGASHQMLEDIGNMRVLPNMSVIVPSDAVEAAGAIRFVAAYDDGPVYVRLARAAFPVIHDEDHRFEFGKAEILAQGTDVTIAACGLMVSVALEAREVLAGDGISAEIVNVSTIKPLDRETLLASASKTGVVVTAEEHQIVNGQSGDADALLAHYGLDVDGLVAATKQALTKTNG